MLLLAALLLLLPPRARKAIRVKQLVAVACTAGGRNTLDPRETAVGIRFVTSSATPPPPQSTPDSVGPASSLPVTSASRGAPRCVRGERPPLPPLRAMEVVEAAEAAVGKGEDSRPPLTFPVR